MSIFLSSTPEKERRLSWRQRWFFQRKPDLACNMNMNRRLNTQKYGFDNCRNWRIDVEGAIDFLLKGASQVFKKNVDEYKILVYNYIYLPHVTKRRTTLSPKWILQKFEQFIFVIPPSIWWCHGRHEHHHSRLEPWWMCPPRPIDLVIPTTTSLVGNRHCARVTMTVPSGAKERSTTTHGMWSSRMHEVPVGRTSGA